MQQLSNLVDRLQKQHIQKKDMVLSASKITSVNGNLMVSSGGIITPALLPTELCHEQIARKLNIPIPYYRRMLTEHPELLDRNVNGWLGKEGNKSKYLIRTFENGDDKGIARAFLSDRFHVLDNYDVLLAALEAIKKLGVNVDIVKAEVTDRRMYLHVTCPEVELQAESFLKNYLKENDAAGNGIISGLVITNSEVGLGSFEVRPRAVICKCNNGLIVKDDTFKRIHLGGKLDEGNIEWSKQTREKNYQLVISQTQDAVNQYLSKEHLGNMVEHIAEASNIKLDNPIDTVHHVCKELSITEEHKQSILNYFLKDGDHNASGVVHAVTREAQNMDADKQFDIETDAYALLPNIKRFDRKFSQN